VRWHTQDKGLCRWKQANKGIDNKHDYTSPTCVNNSIMKTSVIEAKEGRDVAIIDIPGAYLHTHIDKYGNEQNYHIVPGKVG